MTDIDFAGIKRQRIEIDEEKPVVINLVDENTVRIKALHSMDITLPSTTSIIDLCDEESSDTIIVIDDEDDDCDEQKIKSSHPAASVSQLTLSWLFKNHTGIECNIIKLRSSVSRKNRLERPRSGHLFEIIDLTDDDDIQAEAEDKSWLNLIERFNLKNNRMRQITLFDCSKTK